MTLNISVQPFDDAVEWVLRPQSRKVWQRRSTV